MEKVRLPFPTSPCLAGLELAGTTIAAAEEEGPLSHGGKPWNKRGQVRVKKVVGHGTKGLSHL
jgi:hypothetical protein